MTMSRQMEMIRCRFINGMSKINETFLFTAALKIKRKTLQEITSCIIRNPHSDTMTDIRLTIYRQKRKRCHVVCNLAALCRTSFIEKCPIAAYRVFLLSSSIKKLSF